MDSSSLLQYVGAVKDLEAALFANEKIAEGARAKAPKKPTPPVRRNISEPKKPSERIGGFNTAIGIILGIFGLLIGGLTKYIVINNSPITPLAIARFFSICKHFTRFPNVRQCA